MRVTALDVSKQWGKPIATLCLIAALAGCSSERRASEPAPVWAGVWQYDADLPPDAGGSPVTMRYLLTVAESGSPPAATLVIRGFQTDETLLGDVETNDNSLAVTFRSFGDGRTVNQFGVEPYRRGERLITLSRESVQGMVVTEWQGLDPPAQTLPRKGVYFRSRSSSGG